MQQILDKIETDVNDINEKLKENLKKRRRVQTKSPDVSRHQ